MKYRTKATFRGNSIALNNFIRIIHEAQKWNGGVISNSDLEHIKHRTNKEI